MICGGDCGRGGWTAVSLPLLLPLLLLLLPLLLLVGVALVAMVLVVAVVSLASWTAWLKLACTNVDSGGGGERGVFATGGDLGGESCPCVLILSDGGDLSI
jgi:hypothetical protein